MLKWFTPVVLAASAIAGAYGFVTALSSLKEARSTIKQLEAQVQALESRTAQIKEVVIVQQQKQQESNRELQEAIKQEPDWSSAVVPDAVASGLCQYVQCT